MTRRIFSSLLTLATLCGIPALSLAQAPSIPFYEFTSCAVDYPSVGGQPSLQASLGQTIVTVDPPTNAGQDLAFLGFWETGVKFLYQSQVDFQGFGGGAGTTLTDIPVTFDLLDATNTLIERIVTTASSGATTTAANFAVSSWANSSAVVSLAAKSPVTLRRINPLTTNGAGYPGASFALLTGDVNNDNVIDFGDLSTMLQGYNALKGDPLYDTYISADINYDGGIDFGDLSLLLLNYNTFGDE